MTGDGGTGQVLQMAEKTGHNRLAAEAVGYVEQGTPACVGTDGRTVGGT